MTNRDRPNPSLSLEELRLLIDTVRSEASVFEEKRAAKARLEAHFYVRFQTDGYAKILFDDRTSGERKNGYEQTSYLVFKSDFDRVIHEAIAVFLEKIETESFENNYPEAYFKKILSNKLATEYHKRRIAVDKKLKEEIKQKAKGQPTINDFYKYFTAFMSILNFKNAAKADAYEASLFSDFSEDEKKQSYAALNAYTHVHNAGNFWEKIVNRFRNLHNIELIWAAIQAENRRCFAKCVHLCAYADVCMKHLVMIEHKEGGVPYNEIAKTSPFKSIRELISRRRKAVEKNYINQSKTSSYK